MARRTAANTTSELEREARELRAAARQIFQEALAQSTIREAFARHVNHDRGALRICDDLYSLAAFDRVSVVSIGKGAQSMAEALVGQVGESFGGIVAGSTEAGTQLRGFRYFHGGHPLPNRESLGAGRAILRYVGHGSSDNLVIFLISGGGSACVEYPIDQDISLDDIVKTYEVLVHSGAPIAEINTIRKHLSAIKGGRLAQAAAPAQQVSILVSDVPDKALDSLSSGLTMPDSTTVEDCYRIAEHHAMVDEFPLQVRELFTKRMLEETPKSDDPAFVRARWWPVLSNSSVLQMAAAQAAAHGFAVEVDNSCDDWDYAKAADHLLNRLRKLRKGVSRACIISGGEVTVKVKAKHGSGGRNSHFGLYCAEKIAGENITVLSAGTDGIDGNSAAAGAVADGTTLARAEAMGLSAPGALAAFDAFPFFDRLGDAIVTGPTGNNLRDLRVLMAW
ncbi:MAG: glycerate kinase type-2 family protein [Terriglobales bacterium]